MEDLGAGPGVRFESDGALIFGAGAGPGGWAEGAGVGADAGESADAGVGAGMTFGVVLTDVGRGRGGRVEVGVVCDVGVGPVPSPWWRW